MRLSHNALSSRVCALGQWRDTVCLRPSVRSFVCLCVRPPVRLFASLLGSGGRFRSLARLFARASVRLSASLCPTTKATAEAAAATPALAAAAAAASRRRRRRRQQQHRQQRRRSYTKSSRQASGSSSSISSSPSKAQATPPSNHTNYLHQYIYIDIYIYL